MAAPVSHQWFLQWSPTTNNIQHQPYLHQPTFSHQHEPILQNGGFQHLQNGYIQHPIDPYRGYDYSTQHYAPLKQKKPKNNNPTSARNLLKGNSLPGTYIVGGGKDLSALQAENDPFIQENFPIFHSHGDLFPAWQNSFAAQDTTPPRFQDVRRPAGHASTMLLLPALLSSGLVGGSSPPAVAFRGDQPPPDDPDRDLGGPAPLRTLYQWNLLDFAYVTDAERDAAIEAKEFIPENTLPLGLESWRDRVFVTVPRWKSGVPCTLATAPRTPPNNVASPKLEPYPDWTWHRRTDCSGLTSVFRITADRCGRLWVLDSGQVDALTIPRQVCPPQLLVFDLSNDNLLGRWPIPPEHVRQNSLFTNIVADIRNDKCEDIHVYFTDVWRFSILVFRLRDEKFWRFNSHLFYPAPLASDYNVHGISFQWSDGVFGISLTPVDKSNDRTLYFHPMSSYREFKVMASILRNETAANDTALLASSITLAGESRGYSGQSSASAIDRNGVMFYNLVTRDAVGCWDSKKPYKKTALGVVAQDDEKLIFPNDLKIDNEPKQSVWVLSNRLPFFLYRTLNPNDVNFRIMREYVDEAVAGTVCDPKMAFRGSTTLEPECD